MPKIQSKQPKNLQPYLFHGIDLNWKDGDKEAIAECPFCGREDKFSVDIETGKWQCFVCGGVGNFYVFLQKLWNESDKRTTDYSVLAERRGLRHADTLMAWQVVRSITTGDWLVPGFGATSKLSQLYRYVSNEKRSLLLPTPVLGHRLFGVNLYDKSKSAVFLCEGPWDAMVLWELLGQAKDVDGELKSTANRSQSILGDANILAVPSCTVFAESWLPLFAGKDVHLMYDSDYPGITEKSAGWSGMQRVSSILLNAKNPPASINCIVWGESGFDPKLPSGYDLKDHVS